LARDIAEQVGIPMGNSEVSRFSDGEISVNIHETVRGADVFVVQSTCHPGNDNLMEMLIMIDAFKRASAGRITAVMPYYGYARQDRKAKARDPITAKLIADLITTAGADRGFDHGPARSPDTGIFLHTFGSSPGRPHIVPVLFGKGFEDEDLIVVSPDIGSVTRARTLQSLKCAHLP